MASIFRAAARLAPAAVRAVSSSARTSSVVAASRFAFPASRSLASSASASANLGEFLKNEFKYEKDSAEPAPQVPSGFTITEKPFDTNVVLTSTYKNEDIRVTFQIDKQPDPQMDDEENEEVAPYGQFSVSVTKKVDGQDAGTLTFDITTDNGELFIDGIIFCGDSKLANGEDIDSDWRRSSLYPGPNFNALPEELQTMWYDYLELRGINGTLSEFVDSYQEYKENQEYLNWLKGTAAFISN